nr:radical SAM protein [uncultured Carboxylicivirga sp.]
MSKVLLVTPPLTQLNTPYPATLYLKGYFNTVGINSHQCDLGIELIDVLFSSKGLERVFSIGEQENSKSEDVARMLALRDEYISVVDVVMNFLRQPTTEQAYLICNTDLLPHGSRFAQLDDLDWLFGSMGLTDKAKHLCTLFLEDVGDFITTVVDSNFGFSRYAERLGRSATSFDHLYEALNAPLSLIDEIMLDLFSKHLKQFPCDLVAISIPFPGNLFGALRIGQWIKQNHPEIKVSWGGGFVNTELRSVSDPRVFEFVDFITLDDGEKPLQLLSKYLDGKHPLDDLMRTFILKDGVVTYINNEGQKDIAQKDTGAPDYTDLPLEKYISVVEVANPMFRLWSDGRWLKLTLAHGCYWGKCTFCDGSLDYIGRYEPNRATDIVDRMEQLMTQTGLNGFHFVDEAAPPMLLKEVALELLRRKLKVTWWTNIRFERSFTADVCRLLKLSGCIAVSGGLEVASDRILKLINKGVDLSQVTNVTSNFEEAGIMVHAYLMYGFPTQTIQETIDSLEVVRQLFDLDLLTSAFWHQFAMTAHSDVGLNPDKYHVEITGGLNGSFANNDLFHLDPQGGPHELFGEGLKKAVYNFIHGVGLDWPVDEWFEFKTPKTLLPPHYLQSFLKETTEIKETARWIWMGVLPDCEFYQKKKGKKVVEMAEMKIYAHTNTYHINIKKNLAEWIMVWLPQIRYQSDNNFKTSDLRESFLNHLLGDFDIFLNSYTYKQLKEAGLLVL